MFKVGDKVRVVKSVGDFDKNGMGNSEVWRNCWAEEMNDYIGKEFVIDGVDLELGVTFAKEDEEYSYRFPFSALELVESNHKHPVKHICAFGDVFTTIPEGVYLEVSYTKDFATVYFNYVDFPCKTEERLKEVMQAIQTLFKEEDNV